MNYSYPTDGAWWNRLCFRLSGTENIPVRRLLAGSPELPREGFLAFLEDAEPEVLSALNDNPSLPLDLALRLLRHPKATEVLSEACCNRLAVFPDLDSDDLVSLMEQASWETTEQALLHPNANWYVVERFFEIGGRVDNPVLARRLLERYPWGEAKEVWNRIEEDAQWSRALLSCPATPQAFLVWMAWEQRQQMAFDTHLHEVAEEICFHPNANAEVFEILMEDDTFGVEESNHGLRCFQLISEHPQASPKQRIIAALRLQADDQAESEERRA